MNKKEISAKIAEKTGLTKKAAEGVLEAALDTITETLASGESVQLTGFCNFTAKKVEEVKRINPQDGSELLIPAHRRVAFTESARKAPRFSHGDIRALTTLSC